MLNSRFLPDGIAEGETYIFRIKAYSLVTDGDVTTRELVTNKS
jgi:hypothetical protein